MQLVFITWLDLGGRDTDQTKEQGKIPAWCSIGLRIRTIEKPTYLIVVQ